MPESKPLNERPPGPDSPVTLGIDPATLGVLTGLQRDYGDLVHVQKTSGRHALFINDPAIIRHILVRRHARYQKGPGFERVKMLLGNGLIVSDGDVWRRSRTMIQPAFKVQNVQQLLQAMINCSEQRARAWQAAAEAGKPINITQQTSDFALELILVCIFGADYEQKLLADGDNPFDFLSKDSTRDLSVVLKVRKLRARLLDIIAERRETRSDEFDFLSMYLKATDKQGNPFSDNELLDELMTLIVAGFETSANTLNWVWYLLAGNAAVEARLLEELHELLPHDQPPSAAHIDALPYTQQVIDETLRLYPPVWLFTRRAVEADELGEYGAVPGDDIYLSPYILHRSVRYWPDPERFDPGRFEQGKQERKERPYFPFSLGPRRCLGEYFSFLEMKVHLALLLPRFRMQRSSADSPGLEMGINLRSTNDILLQPQVR